MKKRIPVGMIREDGSHKILGEYRTYDDADAAVDKFCEKYPSAWIDIFDGSLASYK